MATNSEQAEYHEDAARYLREGIYEQKPWLKGAVSFSGPAEDHEEMARTLRSRNPNGQAYRGAGQDG